MVLAGTLDTAVTAVSVTLLLMLAGVVVAVGLAVRGVRRRYRRLVRRVAGVALGAGPRPALAQVMAAPIASPTWWTSQLDRRRLWRSVTAAEHAVAAGKAAGVPLGDLPLLSRDLRRAAQATDSALLAASRGRTGTPIAVQRRLHEVADSADRIHGAVLESLAMSAHGENSRLEQSIRMEVDALRAGLASAQAAGTPRSHLS